MQFESFHWLSHPGIFNNIIPLARVGYEVKITNERVVRVGYNHFISNKGEWNNIVK